MNFKKFEEFGGASLSHPFPEESFRVFEISMFPEGEARYCIVLVPLPF